LRVLGRKELLEGRRQGISFSFHFFSVKNSGKRTL